MHSASVQQFSRMLFSLIKMLFRPPSFSFSITSLVNFFKKNFQTIFTPTFLWKFIQKSLDSIPFAQTIVSNKDFIFKCKRDDKVKPYESNFFLVNNFYHGNLYIVHFLKSCFNVMSYYLQMAYFLSFQKYYRTVLTLGNCAGKNLYNLKKSY